MSVKNVQLPPLLLLLALLLILMGCISLLFGYHARHGAVMLFGVTMAAATTMHDFWHIAEPSLRAIKFGIFSRNIAICGGLLVIVGLGPGPFAITHHEPSAKRRIDKPLRCPLSQLIRPPYGFAFLVPQFACASK
jgi:putative oxidoreductase